jgi:hypothetical protein
MVGKNIGILMPQKLAGKHDEFLRMSCMKGKAPTALKELQAGDWKACIKNGFTFPDHNSGGTRWRWVNRKCSKARSVISQMNTVL